MTLDLKIARSLARDAGGETERVMLDLVDTVERARNLGRSWQQGSLSMYEDQYEAGRDESRVSCGDDLTEMLS